MSLQQSIIRQFDPVAADYATSAVHAAGADLAALVAALPAHAGVALDIGCGPGHTALAIARHVAAVVAIDLSEAMLAQARLLAQQRGITAVRFERGDAGHLPFDDASFDVVTSRYSAHHFPDPLQVLREVARVLRPGGCLLLSDVVAPPLLVADTVLNAVEVLRDPSHVRDHTTSQWLTLCAAAGLPADLLGTHATVLQLEPWLARMRVPAATAEQIRRVFAAAPDEVRTTLCVDDQSFTVTTALLRARRA
ncbi:MAG: methyltransferase domain-containing protein [Chloroflexi bacterium]|nr:methyltransferase domain-containing protein [Chloroflexota bacterium]